MMLKYLGLFLLSVLTIHAHGQISTFGIANTSPTEKSKTNTRLNAQTPLSLPFWEDFSTSGNKPDTLRWQNSDAIFINNGFARNAPSLRVASFDGINAEGFGYSANSSSTGRTDSLTSCPIALGDLAAADDVFLSFYYQYGGNGDSPDNSDSIRLEFLNSAGEWINMWPRNESLSRDTERFEQVVIRVEDEQFFHDNFQFQFESFGRQSGAFDIWNLDYIYLNDSESPNLFTPDRTISAPFSSVLDTYYSVPAAHFNNDLLVEPSFTISSVDSDISPQPYSYKYQATISSKTDDVITNQDLPEVQTLAVDNVASGQIIEIPLTDYFTANALPEGTDSMAISLEAVLQARDNEVGEEGDFIPELYDTLDFRLNDTLRTTYIFDDFYAYDDGDAELAAGLNVSGDLLAYQFDMTNDTTDNIVAVDMYFPFTGSEPSGSAVDFIILRDLRGEPNSQLYSERITIGRTETLNEFIRYELRRSTVVSGTFYIGYRQTANGRLGLGLDISNDTGDRMFFNLDGVWRQNQIVRGSFMMRPVFGEAKIVTSVGSEVLENQTLKLFPNPSNGSFTLKGRADEINIYDINGRQVEYQLLSDQEDAYQIDISDKPDGLYLLKVLNRGAVKTLKLIKRQ